jgi:hypothetical protein
MMRAVWLILAAGFRRQWKSWLLLTVLIAVASGFVLASTAAGRRTDSAFPRYVASHGYDAIVYTVQPLPQLGQLPEVAQVTPVQMPFIGLPGCVAYDLYPGPGFAVATKGTPALTSYYVRLRHGQADFARFEARTSRVDGAGVQDLDRPAATITSSIHPQAVGWLVLAALAGLAAVAVVGPALARQASAESADHPVLAALGLSPRQLAARIMLRTLVVAVAGAAGGIAVATLLSPLAPLGEARLAEPAPGLSFDAGVLGLGALATVAVVLALGVLPALRAARMRGAADRAPVGRTSAVAGAAAAAGAPPGAVIGIRRALERGRGSRAVPVGTALIGSVAGVAALCVTAVFGSSLAHLTATPALYGAPFQDIFIGGGPGDLGQDPVITELKGDRAIGQITLVSVPAITVNRIGVRAVAATAVRGPMLLSAAEGRLPADDGQIALGASTMRMVGARIGSLVRVTATPPAGACTPRPPCPRRWSTSARRPPSRCCSAASWPCAAWPRWPTCWSSAWRGGAPRAGC